MVRISLKRSQKPQKQGIESVISEILHLPGAQGAVAVDRAELNPALCHFPFLKSWKVVEEIIILNQSRSSGGIWCQF